MSDYKKQIRNWYLPLVGMALAALINAGAFEIDKTKTIKWADLTGFGKGTVSQESIERKTKGGSIEKIVEPRKYQSGKTLWDWLKLLTITILIFFLGQQLRQRDKKEQARLETEREIRVQLEAKESDRRAELEKETGMNYLAEEAMQNYIDRVSDLLLNKELREELFPDNDTLDQDNHVRDVARIRTITILRRLEKDTERQASIIYFLRDAGLYQFIFEYANLSSINLSQANLENANLVRSNLEGAYFKGAFLSGANLEGAFLAHSNLEDSNLFGAYFKGAFLEGAYFKDANLVHSNFEDANLKNAYLNGANLEGAFLDGANLEDANLKAANLVFANLEGAYLAHSNLEDSNLFGAYFKGAFLEGADFKGANLVHSNLEDANLKGAFLDGANLEGAFLDGANLEDASLKAAHLVFANLFSANLKAAHLNDANLKGSFLRGAFLEGASLKSAKLKSANLEDAFLKGANLIFANLKGANLEGANLEGAKNLTSTQIKSACFWYKAIYKGEWSYEKEAWVAIEPDNTNFIEELKKNTTSDPEEPPDCSYWKNPN